MAESSALLPFAVHVYGCLHLLDNVAKAFPETVLHWKTFHAQLHVCATLLRQRSRRQRFVHTSLGVDHINAHLFEHFSGQLLDHRWFSVFSFVSRLPPLLPTLRARWRTESFVTGVDSGTVGDAEFDPHEFGKVMRDKLFPLLLRFCQSGWEFLPQAIALVGRMPVSRAQSAETILSMSSEWLPSTRSCSRSLHSASGIKL